MDYWQYTPYTLLLFLSGGISLVLALYSLRHWATAGAKTFTILMTLIAIWSWGYGFELASVTLSAKLFWAKVQYIGIAFTPAAWLYLSLQYTGWDNWFEQKSRNMKLLLVGPLITAVLVWSNEVHGLIWASTQLNSDGPFTMLSVAYGPWFWVHLSLSYLYLIFGTITLGRAFLHGQSIYKGQAGILLFGALMPWVGNALYITGLNPLPGIDLTPFAFTITGLITASGLFQFRILNIVPIARNTVIESMRDGVIVLDSQDLIVDMNPAAENIIQQKLTQAIGQTFTQTLANCNHLSGGTTDDQGKIAEIITGVGQKARYYEVQTTQLNRRHWRNSGQLIVLHETTERKRSEAALQMAKEEAETAVRTKSAFLANMSHEIRTPLNAVIGMAELLRNTPLNAEQKELVETVYTSSDTLLGIINNILDFSKIEAGKVEMENQPFDLRDCLEVSLNLITPRINPHAVKLAYYIDEQTPNAFNGDVVRLRQILVNLLGNAAKFTEEGEISVNVNSERLDGDQYRLHFSVKDTGIGIPADRIDRLFASFSQADASTTRKYGGTGLGLAISKKLSQLMGGDIWVESQIGVGSAFHFTVVAGQATHEPVRRLRQDQPRLHGKRLLIIAGNADNRRFISRETRSWGMSPYVAGSGDEARYWLQKSEPYDIALLDQAILESEDTNGPALIKDIQQHHGASLPIVLLRGDNGLSEEYGRSPFAAVLQHPFTSAQLNNVLAGVFTAAQGTAASPQPKAAISGDMGTQHPLRILLAEDNRINQKVATRILGKLGYEVEIANNGREAIAALEQQPYDVILMDIQMPELDGVEATKEIRAQWPPHKQPRIIAMTAHALQGDREHYLGAGMDDYISKPVQIDKLVEALYKCAPLPDKAESAARSDLHNFIHMDGLKEMIGSEAPQMLQELLPIFMVDAEKALTKMQQAITQDNLIQVKLAAHSLKGNSASLSIVKLAGLCQQLEDAQNGEDASRLVDAISQELTQFKAAAGSHIAAGQPA